MAISPWHVAAKLSGEQVAAILGGYDIAAAEAGYVRELRLQEKNEWEGVILQAVQDGSLKAVYKAAYIKWNRDAVAMTEDGRDSTKGDCISLIHDEIKFASFGGEAKAWVEQDRFNEGLLRRDAEVLESRFTFERQEVYRWLKASGITDNDIPEALRVMPKPQAPATPQDKPLHHKRRQTYLKLVEGLALEVLGGEIPDEPYKAAAILQAVLERHGLKLDDEPIAKTVQEILATREERASDPF
ncbi:hypothetical protein [Halomonas chromatireducens]|uniref:Uncharacterized protein n=1 Tax=Halomonas chromatireducens TaxID=507626 RepID=A0A109UKR2_9GAMM|nr:hypothetical protein [Halomonas chromatireducens]AMC99348.1 hypothetical protein LOKO_00252 [Halomonas chromatireducens]